MIIYVLIACAIIGVVVLVGGLIVAFIPSLIAGILALGFTHLFYLSVAICILLCAVSIIRFLLPAQPIDASKLPKNEDGENDEIKQPLVWQDWLKYFGMSVLASIAILLIIRFGITPINEFLLYLSDRIMEWVNNFKLF